MVKLQLKRQIFKEISLKSNIHGEVKLEIGTKFNFNIRYSADGKTSVATLRQIAELKSDPSALNITVEAVGVFDCEQMNTPEDKREAHIAAYHYLFPYAQRKIAELFVDAGFPPLMLKMAEIREEDIVIVGTRQN